jgi:predicted PurR-regulated permease PerM
MDTKKVIIEFSYKSIFWVVGLIASLWLIIELRNILIALLLAFIFATAISPLINLLQKRGIPRPISISLVYIFLFSLLFLVVRLVVPPFAEQVSSIVDNRIDYASKVSSYFHTLSPKIRESINTGLYESLGSLEKLDFSSIFSSARGIFSGVIEFILVLAISFYMLMNKRGVEDTITGYIPKQFQKKVTSLYRKIAQKMTFWLRGQIALAVIIFLVNLVGLSFLKVEYALTLALVAGLLEVVPVIGPIIAGVLAVTVALTQSPVLALIVALWFILVQQLENHVIVPQVMKKSLGLSPIVVILALLIGGQLMGFVGILISVPIAAAIGVIVDEFIKNKEAEVK